MNKNATAWRENGNKNIGKGKEISKIIIFLLLFGTAVRVPISGSATVSLGEIILSITLFIFILLILSRKIKFMKQDLKIIGIIYIILSFLAINLVVNTSNSMSVLLIFEYLFIGIVLLFIFNKIGFNLKSYYAMLIVFSLYLSVNSIIFNVINYEVGNTINILKFGSNNYTTAIMLLIIPILYVLLREELSPNLNWVVYLSISLMIISIFYSGSRSNIVVLLFQLSMFTFVVNNSLANRFKIIFSAIIIGGTAYSIVSLINPQLSYVVQRYLSFFYNDGIGRNDIINSDLIRDQLKEQAWELIVANKFWGTGFARLPNSDIPIHNFIYEILLGIGSIGLIFFLVYFLIFIIFIVKKLPSINSIRLIIGVMILSFLAISWVHPFMTTGKEFTLIFWLNMVGISYYIKPKASSREVL